MPSLPAAAMDRYLSVRLPLLSDDVIHAPKPINPKADSTKEPLEFKLQGQNYVRCSALIKKLKHTKQRISLIWLWGEDLQLKYGGALTTFYYCYKGLVKNLWLEYKGKYGLLTQ